MLWNALLHTVRYIQSDGYIPVFWAKGSQREGFQRGMYPFVNDWLGFRRDEFLLRVFNKLVTTITTSMIVLAVRDTTIAGD